MYSSNSPQTEEDVKHLYITPAIERGWAAEHIRMEARITDGRFNLRGNLVARERPKKADYLLCPNGGAPMAVVEAKDASHGVSYGLQQAKTYAEMMDLRFAYSSNGHGFTEYDFFTGVERNLSMDEFPSEQELVARRLPIRRPRRIRRVIISRWPSTVCFRRSRAGSGVCCS